VPGLALGHNVPMIVAVAFSLATSATIVVDNLQDAGVGCTLREAFVAAQTNDGSNGCSAGTPNVTDTIVLDSDSYTVTGTPIVLDTAGEPIRVIGVSRGYESNGLLGVSVIKTTSAAGLFAVTAASLELQYVFIEGGTDAAISCTGASLRIWDSYFFHARDGVSIDSACDTWIERSTFGITDPSGEFACESVIKHAGPSTLRMAQSSFIDNEIDGPAALVVTNGASVELEFNTFEAFIPPDQTLVSADGAGTTLTLRGNLFHTAGTTIALSNDAAVSSARYNVLHGSFPSSILLDTNQAATDLTMGSFAFHHRSLPSFPTRVPTIPIASGANSIPPAECPPLDGRQARRPQGDGCEAGAHETDVFNTLTRVIHAGDCVTVLSGLDDGQAFGEPNDGILHDDEVDATTEICGGAPSATGPQGAMGPEGSPGPQGTTGATGATGEAGAVGTSATLGGAQTPRGGGGCTSTSASPVILLALATRLRRFLTRQGE
jgi:hypothetical protein